MLLTLDTATPLVTVALHDGSDVVAEHVAERAMKHGEQLAPLIERCLLDVGAVRQDLTAIGVGVGPGGVPPMGLLLSSPPQAASENAAVLAPAKCRKRRRSMRRSVPACRTSRMISRSFMLLSSRFR